jgi:D-sedoheptulose 7-phosphate isomerase
MINASEYAVKELTKTKELINNIIADNSLLENINIIAKLCIEAIKRGNKIIFAGNGGSAADAQHLAAELVSRLCFDRPAMAGIAITTDTSALTAIGNDYGYEYVFSRQLAAIGREGDVLIAISTSGNSKNIIEVIKQANIQNIVAIGFTGQKGGNMLGLCDYIIHVPSDETARIQEGHISIGHILCGVIENEIYGQFSSENSNFQIK